MLAQFVYGVATAEKVIFNNRRDHRRPVRIIAHYGTRRLARAEIIRQPDRITLEEVDQRFRLFRRVARNEPKSLLRLPQDLAR